MRRLLASLVLLTAPPLLWADEPREVIARAVEAHGGAANLERMTAVCLTLTGRMPGLNVGRQPMVQRSEELLFQGADRSRSRYKTVYWDGLTCEGTQVFAGGKGWRKETILYPFPIGPDGDNRLDLDQECSAEERQAQAYQMQEFRVRTLIPLLRDQRYALESLWPATVRGRPAVGVQASYPERPTVRLYFDRDSHLLVRTAPATGTGRLYDDYRETGSAEIRLLKEARIETDTRTLIGLLARRSPDPEALKEAVILAKQLRDPSFEVRTRAAEQLVALGPLAVPALESAAKDHDLEASLRAELCLQRIRVRSHPGTKRAALCLLALRAPDGAADALLDFLGDADEATAADIRAALVALAQRPGGPEAALVRALEDADPLRRSAARAALAKDGGVYLDRPNRRLFLPGVRVPYRSLSDESPAWELTVSDWQFVNRFDEKEFARP
jgi:hypothetical protein